MQKLKLGELCAGYGGLGLAAEQAFGAELAWYSEFDAAPSKIMATHWPDVPNHGDMTAIDWEAVEPVDIISGGTPCQDLSAAGRRKGMTDGTRSNLWVNMREAIATIKPTYVAWENVRGAYSATATSDLEFCPGCMGASEGSRGHVLRALGRVLGDLSDLGYDTQWRGLRAADVGAPHPRFRVFVLATIRNDDSANVERVGAGRQQVAYVANESRERRSASSFAANNESFDGRHDGSATTDARRHVAPGRRHRGADWAEYSPAIRRWEALRGTAPSPIEPAPKGGVRLSARFCEWLMGLPAGWVTGVDISRTEQMKALGNGVVPQQAVAALRDMLTYGMEPPA